MVWIGAIFAAFGLYIMLVGAGVLPIPGGPSGLNGPLWIAFVAGLPFFLGGLAVLLQGFGKANANGELPADAPAWMRAAQQLIVVAIFAALATIGTWIALAGDPRGFSGSFGSGAAGIGIGRVVFGIGALICWACTIGVAVSAVRKLTGAGRKA